jgi:hypothetical protein
MTINVKLADVQTLLREWEASFDQTGVRDFEIKIAKDHIVASGWVNDCLVCRLGPSIGEALQKFRADMSAPRNCARMRASYCVRPSSSRRNADRLRHRNFGSVTKHKNTKHECEHIPGKDHRSYSAPSA